MQKPFPGPNLLLPALKLTDPPDLDNTVAYKKREAQWKKLISNEHKKWCLCGSYMNHFLPSSQPLQKSESCSERGDMDVDGAGGGTDINEDIIILEEDFGKDLEPK